MGKKAFIIDLGPLEYKVHILYRFSTEELQKYGKMHFNESSLERLEYAEASMFPVASCCGIIDFPNKLKKNNSYDLNVISHEACHCVLYALRSLTIDTHTEDNEELYCYTLGYIVRQIYDNLF